MLGKIGKRNKEVLVNVLNKYFERMRRTMLRDAIEKFENQERSYYMEG